MKKKILGIVACLAIATMSAINVNLNAGTNFSNLLLRNIEALADGEGTTPGSMTEAEFAKLGCKANCDPMKYCYANNGYRYTFAENLH